jgi:hypothetical protein
MFNKPTSVHVLAIVQKTKSRIFFPEQFKQKSRNLDQYFWENFPCFEIKHFQKEMTFIDFFFISIIAIRRENWQKGKAQ